MKQADQLECCREVKRLINDKGFKFDNTYPDEIFDYQIRLEEILGTFTHNNLKYKERISTIISGLEGSAKTVDENYATAELPMCLPLPDMAGWAHRKIL